MVVGVFGARPVAVGSRLHVRFGVAVAPESISATLEMLALPKTRRLTSRVLYTCV